MPQFAAFEFLVYVLPGAFLLIALMIMFPQVRAFFGTERIDTGGLGVILIISFGFGLLTNTAGSFMARQWAGADHDCRRTCMMLRTDRAAPLVIPEVKDRF